LSERQEVRPPNRHEIAYRDERGGPDHPGRGEIERRASSQPGGRGATGRIDAPALLFTRRDLSVMRRVIRMIAGDPRLPRAAVLRVAPAPVGSLGQDGAKGEAREDDAREDRTDGESE
jgi:hypothetical protein